MATAKRVAQDGKLVPTRVYKSVKLLLQSVMDGKTTNEEVLKQDGQWVESVKPIPQPDRVVLEMSLQEARALRTQLSHCSGIYADTYMTYVTLDNALNSSPKQATAPSYQGAQQAPPTYPAGMLGSATTPTQSTVAQARAQQEAVQKEVLRWWELR